MNRATRYALGLIVEEMGEALKLVGKALRFGLDTPGPENSEYNGQTARELLPTELGDVRAAIDFAGMNKVFNLEETFVRRSRKLSKLTDPSETDSAGRRLAPLSGDFLAPDPDVD